MKKVYKAASVFKMNVYNHLRMQNSSKFVTTL